jgi:hypothetical protein
MIPLRKAWRRLRSYVTGKPLPWETVHVEDCPDASAGRTIYLVGGQANPWAVVMTCPCGCGDQIQLSLLKNSRPRWRVRRHGDGSVSLHPSIWRQHGCGSHFFVHHGVVRWCPPGRMGRWPTLTRGGLVDS